MNPWLTESLKISIKKKNKLYIVNRKHPTCPKWDYIKTYKKTKQNIKSNIKRISFKQLEINKHNMKKTWDIITHNNTDHDSLHRTSASNI